MKNIILCLLLLTVFGVTGCKKTTEVDPEGDPRRVYTQELQQAQLWLPGKWKLVKVSAMVPNPPVPNVGLVIGAKQISLIQDGVQTDKVDFEVVKTEGIMIKTNAQPRGDNWYIRNPVLYINKNRMFLDLGMAQDLPGYEFVKVN